MKMNVERKRERGRLKDRCLDTIENDMRAVCMCIADVENLEKWRCSRVGQR